MDIIAVIQIYMQFYQDKEKSLTQCVKLFSGGGQGI